MLFASFFFLIVATKKKERSEQIVVLALPSHTLYNIAGIARCRPALFLVFSHLHSFFSLSLSADTSRIDSSYRTHPNSCSASLVVFYSNLNVEFLERCHNSHRCVVTQIA